MSSQLAVLKTEEKMLRKKNITLRVGAASIKGDGTELSEPVILRGSIVTVVLSLLFHILLRKSGGKQKSGEIEISLKAAESVRIPFTAAAISPSFLWFSFNWF